MYEAIKRRRNNIRQRTATILGCWESASAHETSAYSKDNAEVGGGAICRYGSDSQDVEALHSNPVLHATDSRDG